MSFGAMLGMNFINKGIDQFTFGVGKEYDRYAREKAREWQVIDQMDAWTKEFNQKMAASEKFGIHPLAIMGTGYTPSQAMSVGGSSTPSGGGYPVSLPSKGEQRIIDANARKAEAEASILEKELENMGQSPNNYGVTGSGLAPGGQVDGNIYPAESNPAADMQSAIGFVDRYGVDRQGNFYPTPTQSYEQAFSDEGTWQNQILYQMREAWFPKKVNTLKNNWNDPDQQEFKRRFLETRPQPLRPGKVVLWNGFNWQSFDKTKENSHKIFKDGYPVYKAFQKKRRVDYGKAFSTTGSGL